MVRLGSGVAATGQTLVEAVRLPRLQSPRLSSGRVPERSRSGSPNPQKCVGARAWEREAAPMLVMVDVSGPTWIENVVSLGPHAGFALAWMTAGGFDHVPRF